ncbi:hypothetical protein PHYPO_G00216630 [Pangasianodon hypophthalmus]|uniref:Uncharacterized protein n=1 Tax=Pangasianodon hypophthalmus TaxID=310915 RepID=A0A5N5P7M8_PANHP|nr:hypothetical protein PHYPO_G00216630 [Pangasianodon hypophthalmus]
MPITFVRAFILKYLPHRDRKSFSLWGLVSQFSSLSLRLSCCEEAARLLASLFTPESLDAEFSETRHSGI